jgi:predicted aspartyl protease
MQIVRSARFLLIAGGLSLDPPPPAAPTVVRQSGTLLAEVPFNLHQNAVIVKCLVGGRDTVQMLLDTGWGPPALTTDAARRLGLAVFDAGGQAITHAPTLGLGAAVRRDVTIELFTPEELLPLIGPHDGVLGTGFLHDFAVQIDYPAGIVRLYSRLPQPSEAPDAPRTVARMPMVFSPAAGFLPFTDSVSVNGRAVRGLFDTGGSGAFMAMDQLMRRGVLDVLPDTVKNAAIRMFGEGQPKRAPLRFARARSISVGGVRRDSVQVIVAPPQIEGGNWGHDLIIGYGFLRNFIVTFDYPGRTIVLEQRP